MREPFPIRIDASPLAAETRAVTKTYGAGESALCDVSLQVPEGAVYLLVGANGAGKTTLLRTLLDAVRPTRGAVRVFGEDVRRAPPRTRALIGYVPEDSGLPYPHLTAGHMLRHHSAYYPAWDRAYARRLCERFGVPLERRCDALSKGHARRLMLVMALAHRPPLLLLDEPTDGFDPLAREDLHALLVEHMSDAPTTILWCTHHVSEAERLADHVGVLHRGHLVAQARRDEVDARLRRYRVQPPAGGMADVAGTLLRREGAGREEVWTLWGDETRLLAELVAAGATVRDVAPLTLEETAVAFLSAGRAA